MKKRTVRIISVIMACLLCGMGAVIPAAAATCSCPYDPIVYVFGKHDLYQCDDDGNYILDENGKQILNTANNFDYGEMTSTLLPLFAKAYFSDNWTEFSDALLAYFLPLYEGRGCDGNGDVIDYVHYRNDDCNSFGWYEGTTHGYHMGWNNTFNMDYRESPIVVAAKLDEFINQVKERTGHDKVVIATRCQGANIVMAWLQLYQSGEESPYVAAEDMPAVPFEDVSRIAILDGCMEGIDAVENLFSGHLDVCEDALYRYVSTVDLKSVLGEDIGELISLLLDSLKETYGINLTVDIIKNIYSKFSSYTLSPIIRAFYGTCGGIISCIKDNFDEYVDFIFPTDELKEEYAGLIEKATYVNKNITTRTNELLTAADENGVKIGVFAEYGFQSAPNCPESAYCGDTMTSLVNQSIGATTAEVDGVLSEEYINSRIEAGYGKYISPDKQVDTSTCLFPETTWVIKNAAHVFTECIHVIMVRFLRDDATVSNSDGFLNFVVTESHEGYLEPMQEKNANDIEWGTISDVEKGKATLTIFDKIIEWLNSFIEKIKQVIQAIIIAAKG